MADKLQFRRVSGEQAEVEARLDDTESHLDAYLTCRKAWFGDGTELRQHRLAHAVPRTENDEFRRREGYDRLDNEILAGRRLYSVAGPQDYPQEVACLYGDEAVSGDPYALFEPYQGEPLSEVGAFLLADEFLDFTASLLTGLCWLAAAGIAHRAVNPNTVRWDSQSRRTQIANFSLSTVFGVPRLPVPGSWSWVAREQRAGEVYGTVGDRDDLWAAGKLIFYVRNQGTELSERSQLADSDLQELLDGVFGPVEGRPSAGDLLSRLGRPNPAPPARRADMLLYEGRQRFLRERRRKHPGLHLHDQFFDQADTGGPAAGEPPAAATSAEEARPPQPPGTAAESPGSDRTRPSRWKRRGE